MKIWTSKGDCRIIFEEIDEMPIKEVIFHGEMLVDCGFHFYGEKMYERVVDENGNNSRQVVENNSLRLKVIDMLKKYALEKGYKYLFSYGSK